MLARRTLLGGLAATAVFAGCLGDERDDSRTELRSDGSADDRENDAPTDDAGQGPRATFRFQDYGDGLSVSVMKLDRADRFRIEGRDCDVEADLETALNASVSLTVDDELADCEDEATIDVVGEYGETERTVASYDWNVDAYGTSYDGNAGPPLDVGIGIDDQSREDAVTFVVKSAERVDGVSIRSPDCDVDVHLEATAGNAVTLRSEDELRACGQETTLWLVGEHDGAKQLFATYDWTRSSTHR
ncbi:hypothetical protein ACFOZ7_22905 [Natribaculum luteum]|uniref:Lipoprotein n=1 Tax=Natribaculum luteum TaxID=1586232 RepID=A0ABD5P6G2_9EURY|nr:hypothetical protein [Natribaculum luteum]